MIVIVIAGLAAWMVASVAVALILGPILAECSRSYPQPSGSSEEGEGL